MYSSKYAENGLALTLFFEGHIDALRCQEYSELVGNSISELKEKFPEEVPAGFRVVFDLEKVSYIASSFIRICVATAKQFPKGGFVIANGDPNIKKTFKIVGLDDLLPLT